MTMPMYSFDKFNCEIIFINLLRNLGHQKSILIGLSHLFSLEISKNSRVVVMDADNKNASESDLSILDVCKLTSLTQGSFSLVLLSMPTFDPALPNDGTILCVPPSGEFQLDIEMIEEAVHKLIARVGRIGILPLKYLCEKSIVNPVSITTIVEDIVVKSKFTLFPVAVEHALWL